MAHYQRLNTANLITATTLTVNMPIVNALPKRIPGASITGRMNEQDSALLERRHCAGCSITYYQRKNMQQGCPLCASRQEATTLRAQVQRLQNELQIHSQTVEQFRAQISEVEMMKSALTVIGGVDLAFVKSFLYQWKEDRGFGVLSAVLEDREGRYAFHIRFRDRRVDEWPCQSVGGVALARAFEQAVKLFGNIKATEHLHRSVVHFMANTEAVQ